MKRGLTLIELLAVIAMVSLVAAMGVVGLVAGSEHAQLNTLVSRWHEMDTTARLMAQTGTLMVMGVDRDPQCVTLRTAHEGRLISQCAVLRGWLATIRLDDQDIDSISFDSLGRSLDYQVVLLDPRTSKSRRWRVCGLTGWVTLCEESP